MKKKKASILIVVFALITLILSISIDWAYDTFGNLSLDEVVFHLKVPMEGTNTDQVGEYFKECLWKIIIGTGILSFLLIYPMKRDIYKLKTSKSKKTASICVGISALMLLLGITQVVITADLITYIKNQIDDSMFIANEYVDPKNVLIEFPEEKRNLIYIFLESMETTYYSKKDGGLAEKDLIPEISKLAKQNISFSNTNNLGGAYSLYGTTWTAGAMTAQTLGVPLKIGIDGNSFGEYSVFLQGAYGIGDVLNANGYHNFLLLGSNAAFGGRKNLFTQHGNYEIWDFESAMAENRVKESIWWGYTDDKLFEYAKEKILALSKKEEPFNFTMLTADTHFENGYKCDDCPEKWDHQYKNVISCSSKRVGEFVNWIKKQDFYENTTIVIVGDHLTMQADFFEDEENQGYDKKVVNIIINSAVEEKNTTRTYSTLDLYPTTLAALGATIEGNKLALGTNLFSNELTLIEKYGIEYVEEELRKTSKFYDKNILIEE